MKVNKKKKTAKKSSKITACPLTALQFLTLRFIHEGVEGPKLREKLAKRGHTHTRAAFYQLIARLVEPGFIDCKSLAKKGRQGVSSYYKVNDRGKESMSMTQRFYAKRTP